MASSAGKPLPISLELQDAVDRARKAACARGAPIVSVIDLLTSACDTRHSMLVGLLQQVDGRITARSLSKRLESSGEAESGGPIRAGMALPIDAILRDATNEAHKLKSHYVGTEHVLLALCSDEYVELFDCAQLLSFRPTAFRREIMDLLFGSAFPLTGDLLRELIKLGRQKT